LRECKEAIMSLLFTIGIIVLVLWLLGFAFFKVLGGLIHIALIVAAIFLIFWLLRDVMGVF
jgi:hypothetical protein